MKPADVAWTAVAAGVLSYELAASRREHEWELLSEAVDRYRRRHPILTNGSILVLAAHLMRLLPARLDPIHRLAVRLR